MASTDVKALRATRILEQGHAFCNWKGRQVLTLDNEEGKAKFKAIEETLALELVEAFQKELDLPSLDNSNEKVEPELEAEENKNVELQKSGGGGKKSKNVAMAAILRQATTGSGSEPVVIPERQVTFKTPSPNLSEDSGSQISQEDSRFVFEIIVGQKN